MSQTCTVNGIMGIHDWRLIPWVIGEGDFGFMVFYCTRCRQMLRASEPEVQHPVVAEDLP